MKRQHWTTSKITNPNHAIKVEAYGSWIQETTSTKSTLTLKTTIHATTHPQPSRCNSPWSPYSYTIHSQHIIDTANMEFLLPPRNILTFLFYGLSFTSQTALFTLLFQDVTVQLTISHPKSPTSSSHTIFLHTLRTENLLPTLLSNLHPSRLMLSCLQLMSPPYTQTLHMMTA